MAFIQVYWNIFEEFSYGKLTATWTSTITITREYGETYSYYDKKRNYAQNMYSDEHPLRHTMGKD